MQNTRNILRALADIGVSIIEITEPAKRGRFGWVRLVKGPAVKGKPASKVARWLERSGNTFKLRDQAIENAAKQYGVKGAGK